jgi:imidazolonepropionase-like amidohydrolase
MIYDLRFTIAEDTQSERSAGGPAPAARGLQQRLRERATPHQRRNTAGGDRPRSGSIATALSATLCVLRVTALVGLFPLSAAAETFLLTGATVHTVSGATITNGYVLVQEEKIAGVWSAAPATDAKQISLAGLQLYPGMIALNTDLGLLEIGGVRATRDAREVGEYTPDVFSWLAVNPDSELLPVARGNGIAYFEPVPQGAGVAGYSGLLAIQGWTTEQMVVRKSVALHIYWPGAGLDLTPKEKSRDPGKWKSLEDQDQERREKVRQLDDFVAEARAYAKAKAGAKEFAIVPAWEAMLPVVRGEIPVTIHADDVRQIRAAVSWAATNGVKMILAEGLDAWRVADLLATNHVPVIFDHVYTQPQRETDGYPVHFRAAGVLNKAGVKFAFSGGGGSLVKNLPYTAAQAVAFGLPADEALKAITLYPAQIAGVADRLGSIAVGKDATFFVTDGDVLDIRSNVKRMWIGGHEVSLESRHTRLYEKYKNRPKAP